MLSNNIRPKNVISTVLFSLRRKSVLPDRKSEENVFSEESKRDARVSKIFRKNVKEIPKKTQEIPFAKSLFLGQFDTDILAYPELPKEHVDELESAIERMEFSPKNNFKECITELNNKNCLGFQVPVNSNGQEMSLTEHIRFNERIVNLPFKYNCLNNETLGINVISRYGNEYQKKKYLNDLIDGKIISAFCGLDSLGYRWRQTKAKIDNSDNYVINGVKRFVFNARCADFFIVFTEMEDSVKDSMHEIDLTAFLIDKNTPGIRIEEIDTENIDSADVFFDNVLVSKESILGTSRDGRRILSQILPEYYLNYGVLSLDQHRRILKYLSEYYLEFTGPAEHLHESDLVTSRIGKIVTNAYVVESTTYLTSGISTSYQNADIELESVLVKVLANELLLDSTTTALSLVGMNDTLTRIHHDAVRQLVVFENNSMLKAIAGLLGLQHAGRTLGETVKKLRNPLHHGMFVLKSLWKSTSSDNPKLTLGLKNHLHMSCLEAANLLEYCVLRLESATKILLSRDGIEVINKHSDLLRLAECVAQIYAMTACLGRASRSYCIGLKHSDTEVKIACTIVKSCTEKVKSNMHDILLGHHGTPDENYRIFSRLLFENKEYFPEHPLKRMF